MPMYEHWNFDELHEEHEKLQNIILNAIKEQARIVEAFRLKEAKENE